jgi:Peptidase A4 family
MRRKWPVLTAAIPLAFGWALVAAHPAAASVRDGFPGPGGQVQPGGPISQLSQPKASCAAGSQYAAFWVGLDGYTSKTVEQIGTEADCSGPTPQYHAWYEVYPGAGVNFTNPVSPGDKFTGTVTSQGSDKFQLVLKDTTQSMDTLNPVQITMPDTSVADMASDGSFSVNYTGTGFAQWFGV